jgi:Xaa-Pro aminopeptidase
MKEQAGHLAWINLWSTEEKNSLWNFMLWTLVFYCPWSLILAILLVQNTTELDGLRKAHIRDGAAVVQYLSWLDNQVGAD